MLRVPTKAIGKFLSSGAGNSFCVADKPGKVSEKNLTQHENTAKILPQGVFYDLYGDVGVSVGPPR